MVSGRRGGRGTGAQEEASARDDGMNGQGDVQKLKMPASPASRRQRQGGRVLAGRWEGDLQTAGLALFEDDRDVL